MLLTKLISELVPYIKETESIANAITIMDNNKLEHLPVVSVNTKYVGLVSETELYDAEPNIKAVKSLRLKNPHVNAKHDIYNVLSIMSEGKYSVLPVVDHDNNYIGSITREKLIDEMAELTSAHFPGGSIEIESDAINFSPAIITGVTETNSMKVTSMLCKRQNKSVTAIIKLNGQETTSVSQGLERHGYRIRNIKNGDTKYNDMMEERYDALLKYMEV